MVQELKADRRIGGSNHYVQYEGNGSVAAGWPAVLTWVSFNDLWVASLHSISRSCDQLYKVPNNSDQETQDLKDAINSVAHESRVDHRFILAAIMQETKGCVRAATSESPDGIRNPGLLQSFKGTFSCNDKGKVQTPCPREQILGMITDGGRLAETPSRCAFLFRADITFSWWHSRWPWLCLRYQCPERS